MQNTYKVFLMKVRPDADMAALYNYLALDLGIVDPIKQKEKIYATPCPLCETSDIDEAIQIQLYLENLGAETQIKKPARSTPKDETPAACENDRKRQNPAVGFRVMLLVITFAGVFFILFSQYKQKKEIEANEKKILEHKTSSQNIIEDNAVISMQPPGEDIDFTLPPEEESSALLEEASAAIMAGEFEKAWETLALILDEDPENAEAIKRHRYVAFKLAKKSFEANEMESAIKYMESALVVSPDDHYILAQLGAFHYSIKDFDTAKNYFEDSISNGSTNPDIYLLLAMICYYNGDDMEGAQQYLEKALELAPNRRDIKAFLEKIKSERAVEGDFQSADSEHFVVKFQGVKDIDAAYSVLYILEEAWSDIGYDLGDYPDTPVVVILYTNKQFHDVTKAPHWAGGIFDGRIRLPVGNLPEKEDEYLRRLLYHEYTHVLVHRIANGKCPVWFNEGLAQLMQVRSGTSPDPWLRPSELQDSRRIPSLSSLRAPFVRLNSRDALRAYVTSYFAVKYFVYEYGLSRAGNVLEEIGESGSFEKALFEVTGTKFNDFERRFHEYVKEMWD